MSGSNQMDPYHVVMFWGSHDHYSQSARIRVIHSLSKVIRPYEYLILSSNETLNNTHYGLEPIPDLLGVYRKPYTEIEPVLPGGKSPNRQTHFESVKIYTGMTG